VLQAGGRKHFAVRLLRPHRVPLFRRDAPTVPGCVRGVPGEARTVRARRASSAASEGTPRAHPSPMCSSCAGWWAPRGPSAWCATEVGDRPRFRVLRRHLP